MTYYDRAILFNTIDVVHECKIFGVLVLKRRNLLSHFTFRKTCLTKSQHAALSEQIVQRLSSEFIDIPPKNIQNEKGCLVKMS